MIQYKKKKYWVFYLLEDTSDGNAYDVYAFTDNIEYAKSFMSTRNMEIFYIKTIKLDRDEYNELIRNYMNCELDEYIGMCIDKKYKLHNFRVILTRKEKIYTQSLSSLCVNEQIYQYVWLDMSICKRKYRKALHAIYYLPLCDFIVNGDDNPMYNHDNTPLCANDFNIIMESYGSLFHKNYSIDEE